MAQTLSSLQPEIMEWDSDHQEALEAFVKDASIFRHWLLNKEAFVATQIALMPVNFNESESTIAMKRAYNTGRMEIIHELLISSGIKSSK